MRWITLLGLILCIFLSGGCSSSTPIVEGTATLDGQPIDGGAILLSPLPGVSGATVGGTIAVGKYKLSGQSSPAIGKHRAEVRWVRKTGRMVPPPTNPTSDERIEEIGETVPTKYNEKSELEIDVKAGRNEFDLKLSSK